jgi:hypothetical protein
MTVAVDKKYRKTKLKEYTLLRVLSFHLDIHSFLNNQICQGPVKLRKRNICQFSEQTLGASCASYYSLQAFRDVSNVPPKVRNLACVQFPRNWAQ